MPGTAAKIIVSERQQVLLEEFSRSRTVAKGVVQRATIILLGFQGLFNEDIVLRVGLNRIAVNWRRSCFLSSRPCPCGACRVSAG